MSRQPPQRRCRARSSERSGAAAKRNLRNADHAGLYRSELLICLEDRKADARSYAAKLHELDDRIAQRDQLIAEKDVAIADLRAVIPTGKLNPAVEQWLADEKSGPPWRSVIVLIGHGISHSPRSGVWPNPITLMATTTVDVPAAAMRTRAKNSRRFPRSWACCAGGKALKSSGFTTSSNTGFPTITPQSRGSADRIYDAVGISPSSPRGLRAQFRTHRW
jgi:hypothetical protein